MASLIIESNKQRIPLNQPALTIGNGPKSMIQIQDPRLGPIHCQIVKTTAGFKVLAIDQKTGTLINGVRIREQALKHGDRIQVGATRFIFQGDAAQPARPATGRVPTAQPVRPQTSRIAGAPQAARPATGRVPTAQPARPATGRVPTAQPARPATGRVPTAQPVRPPTGRVPAKPPTGRVPAQPARPGTGRVPTAQPARPATGRVPAARPATARAVKPATGAVPARPAAVKPAVVRPAKKSRKKSPGMRRSSRGVKELSKLRKDAYRKRIPQTLILVVVIILLVVGVTAAIMFWPSTEKEREDFIALQMKYSRQAAVLEDKKDFKGAIKAYRALLAKYNDLSKGNQDYFEMSSDTAKGDIKRLERTLKKFQGEEDRVASFIEDATMHTNSFTLDDAREFLNRNQWVLKAKTDNAKEGETAYRALEKRIEEAEAKILDWNSKTLPAVDKLLQEKNFPEAQKECKRFINLSEDSGQRGQASTKLKSVLPLAREHLKVTRRECRKIKGAQDVTKAREAWDAAVLEHYAGVINDDELKKYWKKQIEDFN